MIRTSDERMRILEQGQVDYETQLSEANKYIKKLEVRMV